MDLNKYKQVISDAIQNEIDAKEFYTKVAKRVKDDYLRKLLEEFAVEEAKHEKLLTDILNGGKMEGGNFNFDKDFKVAETYEMPEVNDEMDLKAAVGLAMKNEEIAMKGYANLSENCEDPELKKVFLGLTAMEREHKFKLEESFIQVAYPEAW
jgi:rubrerythrin